MNKNILLIVLLSLSILISGCGNKQATIGTSTNNDTALNTSQPNADKTTNSNSTTTKNPSTKTNDYIKWEGNWTKGNVDDNKKTGASASMLINIIDKTRFAFTIDATYINAVVNEKGERFLNPHMGKIEGIAYYTSPNEADFTIMQYLDYKMIFKMSSDNTINISEINIKTSRDYGNSPFAGVNVRYFGDYIYKQSQEQPTSYKQYTNSRYGFSIEYPSTFITKVVPDNNDGRIFSTKDNSAELTVSGINNISSQDVKSLYSDLLKEHSNVSYKKQQDNWFVVSWIEGDKIVYEKMVVGSGSNNTFVIKYPSSQKEIYDEIITHLNSSFKTPSIDTGHGY